MCSMENFGRIEHFVNLGKLFHYYSDGELGVDRTSLTGETYSIPMKTVLYK
jgi:hypothetical protein